MILPDKWLIKHIKEILNSGIKSKYQSNLMWNLGLLGNKLKSWNSYDELLKSGYVGTVTVRYLTERSGAGGRYRYEVPISDVLKVIKEWEKDGANENNIFYNENAPDECLLIQGELTYGICSDTLNTGVAGYILFYSQTPGKMRDVLYREGKTIEGLKAKLLLQRYMDEYSFEEVCSLLEKFPDHVIEFSTYDKDLGNIPFRNTIIWEVRDY